MGKGASLIGTSDGSNLQISLNNKIPQIADITTLRTREPTTDGEAVWLFNKYLYRADLTDTQTQDDSTTCLITTLGKRWKLVKELTANSSLFSTSTTINTYLASGLTNIHFNAAITPTGTLSVKSNSYITFTGLGEVDAPATLVQGFTLAGAAPSTWYSLAVDSLAGGYQITLTTDVFSVGDWVEIRSEKLVPGANNQGVKQAQLRKVAKRDVSGSNYIYSLDRVLEYSFLVTDTAVCGKATVLENIVLERPRLNNINYTNPFGIGINCSYVSNLRIINPIVIGSKDKFFIEDDAGTGVAGRSAIKLTNCRGAIVDAPVCHHQGWYGVEVLGCSENVRISDGNFNDCRHGVSVNWSLSYGEPNTVIVERCVSSNATKAGFDTHDVGRNIIFVDCKAIKSQGDGFQYRARNVRYVRCYSAYHASNGFDGAVGATGSIFEHCVAEYNVESGFNIAFEPGTLINCRSYGNKSGVGTMGGEITGGSLEGNSLAAIDYGTGLSNTAAQSKLKVSGVKMPYSDGTSSLAQPRAIYFRGAKSIDPIMAFITDCDMTGYGNNWALLSSYTVQPSLPIMNGNILDSTGITGVATLSAGTITVNTTSARKRDTTNVNELPTVSKIKLTRLSYQTSTPLGDIYVSGITNVTSFTITSTSSTDVSKVLWEIYV